MQTIIGIVICLIVIVYFLIGFMDTHAYPYQEGLTDDSTGTGGVVSNASGAVPLASVVEKIHIATTALGSTVGIDNNPTNTQLYTDHIDNLLDYYDYQILNEIANVKTGADGVYDLTNIIKYNQIKDALQGSQKFLAL
jgi:hypothetical protein